MVIALIYQMKDVWFKSHRNILSTCYGVVNLMEMLFFSEIVC